MFKTTNQHKKYWRGRKIDWKAAYLDTWDHPHRQFIVDKLKRMRVGSLLELGCASGPNLHKIWRNLPNIQLGGVDLNKDAIETGKKLLHPSIILTQESADALFYSDGATDMILTDMCLIYMGTFRIKKTLREMKRVARNDIMLIEFHSANPLKRWALWFLSGYYAYNYPRLLEKAGFYDIVIEKLPPEAWPKEDGSPGGEPQKTFAYLIQAKI